MVDVMAFYAFARWPSFKDHRGPLQDLCAAHEILGSILLAEEGVNGTVSGSRVALNALLGYLAGLPQFPELAPKYSTASEQPFHRLKVRLKREIVTLGVPDLDATRTGHYVSPKDWDALVADPDVVLIDTRNEYEIKLGTFPGAINPHTDSFRDFPAWVAQEEALQGKPRVAMFCTGGIRCEKASAYLRDQGFDEVHQLHGGILKYLEQVPEEDSHWEGECYVFDQRVSVGQGLNPGNLELCPNCNTALDGTARAHEDYEQGVTCGGCAAQITSDRRERFRERQLQIELAEARGQKHLGQ